MSNIQKQHKISPAIAWLTIQKFIIFYCPLDGEHTTLAATSEGFFMCISLCCSGQFYFRYKLYISSQNIPCVPQLRGEPCVPHTAFIFFLPQNNTLLQTLSYLPDSVVHQSANHSTNCIIEDV